MYLGPFYFDTKEIFLILVSLFLVLAIVFGLPIAFFDKATLLTLIIIILLTKGLLPSIHNEAFFILTIITIFLSLYFSIFQVIIFYFLSFLFFRLFKVI